MIKWIFIGGVFLLLGVIALGNVMPWIRIGDQIDERNKKKESESEVA
jgi:hypothetical protein